ncbi:MAG: hypothetical protein ABJF01_25870 [bacterium]
MKSTALMLAGFAMSLATSLGAQGTPASVPGSQSAMSNKRFETGIVLGGDWLQATYLPLDRDALQSLDLSVSLRRQKWSVEAGWLRIARTLSTVQGGYVSGGPLLHMGPVTFIPAVGVLGGQAQASRDSTGYDWTAGGVSGHTARFSYSSAATFGGSVGLTAEVPVYRAIGFRAVASQWFFSGAPLESDRSRTLVGAGLSLRLGR